VIDGSDYKPYNYVSILVFLEPLLRQIEYGKKVDLADVSFNPCFSGTTA